MNEKHLAILQHTIGADEFGKRRWDRNYFVTGEGTTDYPFCMELVGADLMVRCAGNAITCGDYVFYAKRIGMAYVAEHSKKPPKLTRAQIRYREWLADDGHWTFGEWLKNIYGRRA